MIAFARDLWRAVLVVVVAVVIDGVLDDRRQPPASPPPQPAPPAVATQAHSPPVWQPAPGFVPMQPQHIVIQQQPERPLRRAAEAAVGLVDSVIGVVR